MHPTRLLGISCGVTLSPTPHMLLTYKYMYLNSQDTEVRLPRGEEASDVSHRGVKSPGAVNFADVDGVDIAIERRIEGPSQGRPTGMCVGRHQVRA